MDDFRGNLICELCLLKNCKGFIEELEFVDLQEAKKTG